MKKWTGIACLSLLLCLWTGLLVARAQDQGGIKNIFEALDKERMTDPNQAFKITTLLTGPAVTLNLAQLNKVVKPTIIRITMKWSTSYAAMAW